MELTVVDDRRQAAPDRPEGRVTRRTVGRLALATPLLAATNRRPTPAAAASRSGARPRLRVRPGAVLAGVAVTVSGFGFPAKGKGRLVWGATGKSLGTFATDGKGRFKKVVTTPAATPVAGRQTIAAKIGGRTVRGRVSIAVPQGAPVALGAFIPGAPGDATKIASFAGRIGRNPAIVMWFQHWGLEATKAFDQALVERAASRGALPMITWEPWNPNNPGDPTFDLARIVDGHHDTYIDAWARGLREWGGRLLLRWGHEMNGNWYPWSAGGRSEERAQLYKAAWRYIHDRFVKIGATNVEWVWAPNVSYPGSADLADLYPGDRVVDWIGLDGYNWGGDRWQGFAALFGPTLDEIQSLQAGGVIAPGKPMMITETASAEGGGNKEGWIREALLRDLPLWYPQVRAIVWFNETKEREWPVDSSDGALRAFVTAAAHPYYAGALGEAPPSVASRSAGTERRRASDGRASGRRRSRRKGGRRERRD